MDSIESFRHSERSHPFVIQSEAAKPRSEESLKADSIELKNKNLIKSESFLDSSLHFASQNSALNDKKGASQNSALNDKKGASLKFCSE